jgi:hypothetical protein
MNTTRDIVSPAMRAAAEELVGGDAERLYSADTRDLMGLFVMLRKLLMEVCFSGCENVVQSLGASRLIEQFAD